MLSRAACPVLTLLACVGCRAHTSGDTAQTATGGAGQSAPVASAAQAIPELDPTLPIVTGKNERYLMRTEQATLPHFSMSLGQIKACTVEPYLNPKPGHIVLGVEVSLQGTSEIEVPVNPFYAKLEGRSGEMYDATLAGCVPALRSTRVSNKERATGYVSFVVPDGQDSFRFHYRPAIIGFQDEEARFDLGR